MILLISELNKKCIRNVTETSQVDYLCLIEDKFADFITQFIESIQNNITPCLKVMLKLIYDVVIELYEVDRKNYGPLFTYLIFNFIISPSIQEVYNIPPSKYQIVRDINRVIRVKTRLNKNICFNKQFSEDDKLNKYNYIVTSCNIQINQATEKVD
jgi:hypothetical protein